MYKPEWGTKRTCPKCSTRFYDLGNAEPVVCIECGTEWMPEPVLKSKQPIAEIVEKKKEVVDEDDILSDDDDDVELEDDDEDDAVLADLEDDEDDVTNVLDTKVKGGGDD